MSYKIVFDTYESERYAPTLKEAKQIAHSHTMKHAKAMTHIFNGRRYVGFVFGDPRVNSPVWVSDESNTPYILHKDGSISKHPYAKEDKEVLSRLKKMEW